MNIILEILAWIIFEFIGVFLGAVVKFLILKMFNSSLTFDEFSTSESGTDNFYNYLVGIPIFIGLIIGVVFIIF